MFSVHHVRSICKFECWLSTNILHSIKNFRLQSSTIITLDRMSRQKSVFCELVQTGGDGGGWIDAFTNYQNGNEVSSITKRDIER